MAIARGNSGKCLQCLGYGCPACAGAGGGFGLFDTGGCGPVVGGSGGADPGFPKHSVAGLGLTREQERRRAPTDIDQLAEMIQAQADRLFPNRTDTSMFLKIYSEVGELVDAGNQQERAGEVADLMIMLLDYAARHNIAVGIAILTKMVINDKRKWQTNELGVNQHVE